MTRGIWIFIVGLITLVGCSSDSITGGDGPEGMVRVLDVNGARVLTTAEGQTLYGKVADVINDGPTCNDLYTEDCAQLAPLLSDRGDELPDGLSADDFVLFEVEEGFQLGYRRTVEEGIPLYTWIDEEPGEYNGQDYYGWWFVISEEGKLHNSFQPPTP